MSNLATTPLFGVMITVAVFQLATLLSRRYRCALLNPAVVAMVVVIIILKLCHIPHHDYARGGDMLLFLLGPAVVALGVPLYQRRREVITRLVPIVVGITAGAAVSIVTACGIVLALGGSRELALTVAPKSVTTPIAISIATQIGAVVPLTAAVVVVTGCLGAIIGPQLCRMLGINDPAAMGLALGTASHGIGTGRMLEIDLLGGTIAGLAIAINGIITAVLIPLLLPLLLP